jgi:capsid protein
VAEKKGAILGMEAGFSTLEIEAAENAGEDWEELLDQRKREKEALEERGLTPFTWMDAELLAPEKIKDPEPQ